MPALFVTEGNPRLGRAPSRKSEPTEFGEWLRSARNARGWTGEALADEAGTSSANISNLERGIRNPSRDMVKSITKALFDGEDETEYARFEARGLRAAGFASDIPDDPTDWMEDVSREAGFDNFRTMFTPEEQAQIRDEFASLAAVLIASRAKRR